MAKSSSYQQPLVSASGLAFSRNGQSILRDIDFAVYPDEIVTLVGLNGAGKSTLVRVLCGLESPGRGEVSSRPGLRIGYCPQQAHSDNNMPISVSGFLALAGERSKTLLEALAEVGIEDLYNRQLSQLSGGEYQRLLLARALMREPDLLVLDEPMTGIDITGQGELYRLIPEIRDHYGCGVVMVSHDIHVVMAATDRVVCLNHHICCSGLPETVATHPEFIALFGEQVASTLAVYRHHHDHRHDIHGDVPGAGHADGDHAQCEHHPVGSS